MSVVEERISNDDDRPVSKESRNDGDDGDNDQLNNHICDNDDLQQTSTHNVTVRSYKRRWYIVLLFACFPFLNALVLATWGPIASSAFTAFDFTAADIALVSNIGLVGYVPSFPLYVWLVKAKGIRVTMLLGSSLVFSGAAVRLLVGIDRTFIWSIHVGQFITSFAIPLGLVVPPAIVSTWVPEHQRVTVTALFMLSGSFGGAVNGVLGPQLVRQLPKQVTEPDNTTTLVYPNLGNTSLKCADDAGSNLTHSLNCLSVNITSGEVTPNAVRKDILILLTIQTVLVALCTFLVFIYFPAKPPHPPSLSASTKRFSMRQGLRELGRNRPYWLMTVASCLPNASYTVMIVMLEPVLGTLGYSQKIVGWLIFTALTLAMVVSILLGRIFDKLKDHSKKIIIVLTVGFLVFALWLALQCNGFLRHTLSTVYSNVIISSVVSAVIFPLTCDVTCEMAYPVSEGLAMGIFQLFQIVLLSFLFGSVMMPGFHVEWIVWLIVGFVFLSIPMFAACKMRLRRREIDVKHKEEQKALTARGTETTAL
ncbi:solute carrier family 49 member 4 homolog [Tubulanus polymorphus]|uniref:solute carrier family 49 member 4 homolog n=1 Tax=Tubulanus polymorphus TaxID=672921 RepID=UPI003DA54679